MKLVAAKDVSALAGPGLEGRAEHDDEEAPPSAETGRKVGTVTVSVDGRNVGSSPLVVQKGYEEASCGRR